MSLSIIRLCEFAAAADNMFHGLSMLLAQSASKSLQTVLNLVHLCSGVGGLLLSCHDQSINVRSDVAVINLSFICVCSF